jgi:hypothetical protein
MSELLPDLSSERLALLSRAAELRASGTSWDEVAAKLATSTDELRRLACEHARAYSRLIRRATREFRDETMGAVVARLRDLLKSQQEGVAMMAAATLVRYDLAKMRHSRPAHDRRNSRLQKRLRDELPPLPGLTVTAKQVETKAEIARCDTPRPVPQAPIPERVPAAPLVVEKTGCDSPAVPAPAVRGSTRQVDAIRRKQWLPRGLAAAR